MLKTSIHMLKRGGTTLCNRSIVINPKMTKFPSVNMFPSSLQCSYSSTSQPKEDEMKEAELANHYWRQQNHLWNEDELVAKFATKDSLRQPQVWSDYFTRGLVRTLFNSFNFITGYTEKNPTTKSIEWRLIVLESVAGVPGFLAAAFRHFHSLRTLKRDHGAIFTFLEEAENERMHLLVCLKMFEASVLTRGLVITAQVVLTPFLMALYTIKPSAMHSFVGYLEETAVHTYANIIENIDEPGTHLNTDWKNLKAPPIAIQYWNLEEGATWRTTLRHILADEAHHRDVNHTFAGLGPEDENPFIKEHQENFDAAVARRLKNVGKTSFSK
jgi:hypothetical protein